MKELTTAAMEQAIMDVQDARIARQPNPADPKEIAIRQRLGDLLTTEWSRATFDNLRHIQDQFLGFAINNLEMPEAIRDKYEQLIRHIADELKTRVVEGQEHLESLQSAKSIIIVTNHLGTAKLTRIDNTDRHLPVKLNTVEPFPIRPAPLVHVADHLGAPLRETAIELPSPLLEAQKAAGVVTVAAEGAMRTRQLLADIGQIIKETPGTVFVMYPEGGTSGKRNGGGPYDLDQFHKGAFFIAAQLNLPVLPVCQYFHTERGMELYLLPPRTITTADNMDNIAQETQSMMQKILNEDFYSK